MAYNLKVGKGGHGLEVYDDEGKYASDFSFHIGDREIKSYDDFRALYFEEWAKSSAGQFDANYLEQMYNSDPNFKDQIDATFYPEYNKVLTEAVEEHNKATQIWDTPEEAAKNLPELFVPSLVQNLIDNDIINSDEISVARHYQVNIFCACVQMSRYTKRRANLVSKQEYEESMNKQNKAEGYLDNDSEAEETKKYIDDAIANKKNIPVVRRISGWDESETQAIKESFYKEGSPRNSCLSTGNTNYLGTVVYCSTGGKVWSGNIAINGFVKMNDKLKLLECPVSFHDHRHNNNIPEVAKFRLAINGDSTFKDRMVQKFVEAGVGQSDANNIVDRLRGRIATDEGFCAMLMGYDAIWGLSSQFDILNMGIWNIVEE